LPKFPRPRIILKQYLEIPPKGHKGEMIYWWVDKHPYVYQHSE